MNKLKSLPILLNIRKKTKASAISLSPWNLLWIMKISFSSRGK